MSSVKKTKEGAVLNVFKMCKTLQPQKVSPFIKTCRWSFLIFGIFYGINKKALLKSYDERVRPQREAEFKRKNEVRKAHLKQKSDAEILALSKDFEITELPPGWNDDL